MAAATLPAPGTKYGPCEDDCVHRDCAETRRMVAQTCHFCNKPIGYDNRFYIDPDNWDALVHAICLEESVEQERMAKQQTEPRKGEYLIPPGARQGTCRSCGAAVLWITTAKGAAMPLSVATLEERDGASYALSHFADCPQSKGWSKKNVKG